MLRTIRAFTRRATLILPVVFSLSFVAAQAPAGGRPAGAPRGPKMPDPQIMEDLTGFEPIFDGTMKNWDGNPAFWRVENNTIIGEATKENPLKMNTFLIYRGDKPKDFELKLEFRMNSTNSGVQYRSVELPDVGQWVLKGYQADMDFVNQYTGMLYEERGRGIMALRGQMTRTEVGKSPRVIGKLQDGDELRGYININGWNHFHVIARGNTLTHILNGHITAIMVDDDTANRSMEGLLGLQLHVGPPMKVEFRNIHLKKY
jgi:hypothetical protein